MSNLMLQFSEDAQLADLLQQLSSSATSSSWVTRHGAILTISFLLRQNPSVICTPAYLSPVLKAVKSTLEDDRVTGLWMVFLFTIILWKERFFSDVYIYNIYRSQLFQFPVRQASTKALGRLLLYQFKNDPSGTSLHQELLNSIVSSLLDESSEVRRTALSALKSVAKVTSSTITVKFIFKILLIFIGEGERLTSLIYWYRKIQWG